MGEAVVIDAIIQAVMGMVLILGGIAAGVSLVKMHRDQSMPSLNDLITATDKRGKVRMDPRKCFEAGSYLLSTWIMVYLTSSGKMTIEFFVAYLGCWTTARWLRDREQRLTTQQK